MEKKNLISRAEKWHEESKTMPLMGYPRNKQEEITKTSVAIIKTICGMENVTPYIAKEAMKMAADIIDSETAHEAIS